MSHHTHHTTAQSRPAAFVVMAGYAARDAARSMRRNPGLVAATIVTVALAVMLAGAGLLTRTAVDATAARFADGVEFVVYLQPSASARDTDRVRALLEGSSGVDRVDHVSQDEAFDEFTEMYAAEPRLVEAVTPAQLPASFRVAPTVADPAVIDSAVEPLRADPAVYEIVTAEDTVRDVQDLSDTAAAAATGLTVALGLVAVILCASLIRTATMARANEIRVQRLVGASRSYIAAPLVLEGLFSATVAAVIAAGSLWGLSTAAASSNSRVLAALVPSATPATTTAVAAVAAAAVVIVAAISAAAAMLALREAR